jgi:AcrR family transcriptional regulator
MPRHPSHLAEERRLDARRRIVAAALEIVAEDGYGAASVAAVARRAGVATGSIYRHFPSKGELLAEVFRDAAGRERAFIGSILTGEGSAPERLAAAIEAFARRALAAPTLAYALMAEPVDPAVEAARLESKRGYRDDFAALLREGVDASDLPPLDPPVAASALVGALQEALIGPLADHSSGDALVASLVSFAVRSVGAEQPARIPEETHGHR